MKILFAEDSPRDSIPITEYLRDKNCEVVEVCDPKQAMTALEESKFDVVIPDLIMPENNPRGGRQVLEFMNQKKILTPVILATAWGYSGPAQEATQANPNVVTRILTKTFTPQELWAALTEATKH